MDRTENIDKSTLIYPHQEDVFYNNAIKKVMMNIRIGKCLFLKATKSSTRTEHSGATMLALFGDNLMFIETSQKKSNKENVFF